MDKIIYEKVGERLTLEEAGNTVNVHKSTVLRWENGKTEKFKIPILEALANLYNVNPVWLMGYDVPMEQNLEIDNINSKVQNLIDISDLTNDEIMELSQYKDFIISKRKNKRRKNEF